MQLLSDTQAPGGRAAERLLDVRAEPILERLTRMSARLLEAPMALVLTSDGTRVHLRSALGLGESAAEREAPLEGSPWRFVLARSEPLVVRDARAHPLAASSLAAAGIGVAAYLAVPLRTAAGETPGSLCVCDRVPRAWAERDVELLRELTRAALTELELRAGDAAAAPAAAQPAYRAIFEACSEALLAIGRDGRILEANPAAAALLGFARDELPGMAARAVHVDPRDRERFVQALEAAGSVRGFETRLRARDGRELASLLYGALGDGAGVHEVTCVLPSAEAGGVATGRPTAHDALTELPSRNVFLEHMRRLLERRRYRPDYHIAVLVLDLDRFAQVNETLGRAAGDKVLLTVAQRLSSSVRPEDTVARLGNDKFGVLLGDISSVGAVCGVADRIQFAIGQPLRLEGRELRPSASIGIALSSDGYGSVNEFLRSAETAVAEAKASGRAQYVIGRPETA
ncbi:MAG: GGDEF domain-containing protein [Gemmatimonadetes bacterium]|nr:GGDEF domain-containing protein [Gemmatimonadota bacterium]